VNPELLVHVAERLGGRQADEQVGALLPAGQHSNPAIPTHSTINYSITVPIPSDLEHLIINLSTGGLLLASTPTQPFLGIHQSIINLQFKFHKFHQI
jgi:hypothetical protein